MWNYNTSAWERVTASGNDFPSGVIDEDFIFILPNDTDYLSGGEAKLRIYHDSAKVETHYMYIDYIEIVQATLELPVAGTEYQMSGFTDSAKSNNITTDASAGSITIPTDGDYLHISTISFSGLINSKIDLNLVINGSKLVTLWSRRLNINGDVGSASSTAIRTFSAGDVVTWDFVSDVNDSFVSIIAMRCEIIKIK